MPSSWAGLNPISYSSRTALGCRLMPTPSGLSAPTASSTRQGTPISRRVSARLSPPIPAPAIRTGALTLPIHQHEGDAGRLVGAVRPGVVGTALDEHVAGLQQRLALVHHRPDLALEDDRVVDRVGGVHARMALVGLVVRRVGVDPAERRVEAALQFDRVRWLGREIDDPQDRAALRRQNSFVLPYGLFSGDPRRGLRRPPNVNRAIPGTLRNRLDCLRGRVL